MSKRKKRKDSTSGRKYAHLVRATDVSDRRCGLGNSHDDTAEQQYGRKTRDEELHLHARFRCL